jgi:hypothetical protein
MDKNTLKEKAYHELKEYLLITLYLWLVFGLFTLYKSVILSEHQISIAFHGFALINALALGKIMLIAQAFHMGKRFEDAPLIYPTFVKAALFTVILAIFKVIEEVAVAYFHKETFRQSMNDFAGGTWFGIVSFMLIMWVILVPFVAIGELQRVLGPGKLTRLFCGAPQASDSTALSRY